MYSWENIRPGAWLQVVVQSKYRSDGEQPQPYLPFLRVQSGTFYNLSLCPGSLEITVKEPHQGGWGVYVQPLAWEGARLIDAGKSFLSFCFFVVISNVFFLSEPSVFPSWFNSSSTFKYIVGLSLRSETPLYFLCTVFGTLGSVCAGSA